MKIRRYGNAVLLKLIVVTSLFVGNSVLYSQILEETKIGLESIRAEDIHAYINFLAANDLEGRGAGTCGLSLAGLFLASQFEKIGALPAGPYGEYYQPFSLRSLDKITDETYAELEDTVGNSNVMRRYLLKSDFIPFSYTANMKVRAEIMFAGYGITAPELNYDDYQNVDVHGKIVLLMSHVPREKDSLSAFVRDGNYNRLSNLLNKVENARAHGALGVLLVTDPNNYDPAAYSDRRRHSLDISGSPWPNLTPSWRDPAELLILPQEVQTSVVVHISQGMAADILSGTGKTLDQFQRDIDTALVPQSRAIDHKSLTIQTTYEFSSKDSRNVIGMIEGADSLLKKEYVVFTAHYDHIGKIGNEIYNGADDNASGSAALLEIAEAFSLNPVKPRRSILFLHVSAEEKGLLGSKYYVANPSYPMDKTIACINLDMISRNELDSLYIIGDDLISSDLRRIIEEANSYIGLSFGHEYNRLNDPNMYFFRSDQYSFAMYGIPSVFYFTGPHADYHKSTDEVEKVDTKKAARVTRLAFLTGWILANRRESLTADGILAQHSKYKVPKN
ncbi:MAG: M28 family peptidase [Patescibacteria group bacterium]|nr:M28 family peptidase [Patescibacteria group bacterium]